MLVTSRTPLGLYGEQEQLVPPLALPDPGHVPELEALSQYEAVKLFIDRARAARSDFAVTNENAPAVAEICTRLDGLPLGIELAASRIKLLSPQAILSRLGQRLDLLIATARNVPERQRTLRGAIEWSYGLLEEPDRRLFARLSVFAGGAELEAVEAVTNGGGDLGIDTLDGLTSLVDKSLVRQTATEEGEPRFAMLETIREYARERRDFEWDGEATRRRHAEYFFALAEASEPHLTTQDQAEWLDRLDRDHENLQAAFRWAVDTGEVEAGMRAAAAVWRFWQQRGHIAVGRASLERLLARPGGRTAARAKAYGAAGSLTYWQTDAESTERYYEESLTIYQELGDRPGIAQATYDCAFLPILRGTGYEGSLRLLRDALEVFEEIGDQEGVAKAKGDFAFFLVMLGDYRAALPLLEEAVARSRERGDMFHLADDILGLAQTHRMLGNREEARAAYLEALDIHDRADSPTGISSALQMFAALESAEGRHERALRMVGAAEAINESTGGGHPPEAMLGDPAGDAREAIGDEDTDRALAQGRAMSRDEAVAYARKSDD
jgi:predicted ATPase